MLHTLNEVRFLTDFNTRLLVATASRIHGWRGAD